MKIESLVLIEGDLLAQRLIATWPQLAAAYRDNGAALELQDIGLKPGLIDRWSAMALVDEEDVARLAPALAAAEIILPDGEIAEPALAYIRRRLAEKIQG
jgi:hypothetical protein